MGISKTIAERTSQGQHNQASFNTSDFPIRSSAYVLHQPMPKPLPSFTKANKSLLPLTHKISQSSHNMIALSV